MSHITTNLKSCRFLCILKSLDVAVIPSGEEPKSQSAVSVWLFGPAGLCGALSSAVLADTNDCHATKGLWAAGNSAGKPTAFAAPHHSYRTWQQPGGRRSVHCTPQHTHSHGNRHAGQWRWNRLSWTHGHHGNTCQRWTRGWPPAAAQGCYRLADQMVRVFFIPSVD